MLEGDGHFNTPKVFKSSSGKSRCASIEVIFALKDRPLAELLKDILGGNIYGSSNKNMVRWMIRDLKSVTKIVNLVNGKLRTPKINGFYDMIDFINAKGANIEKLPLDTSPLSNNAWLTGFIDSDGYFAIKGFTSNPRTYLSIQFYLVQRQLDRSGESLGFVMGTISDFLQTKLNTRAFSGKYSQFVINTSNSQSNNILIEYLNTFPLLSSKYLDFKDWEKASYIYSNKLHKDPVQFEKVKELKSNMNKNRTVFTWSHHDAIKSLAP